MTATQSEDRPEIMKELIERYWFGEILPNILKGEKLDEILTRIEPINKKWHYQVQSSGDIPELWINGRLMIKGKWIHRDLFNIGRFEENFTKKTMDLVTNKSIMDRLQTLIQQRNKIADRIKELNESLNQPIIDITYNRYHDIFDCCK